MHQITLREERALERKDMQREEKRLNKKKTVRLENLYLMGPEEDNAYAEEENEQSFAF